MERRFSRELVFKTLIFAFVSLFVFLSSAQSAYALDDSIVEKESNGWNEIKEVTLYSKQINGFDGALKTKSDNENCCFYVFFQCNDPKIEQTNTENISIGFRLKNNAEIYSFNINKNGFCKTSEKVMDKIKICYNFDELVEGRSFGIMYVGFEITDKQLRKNDSEIECYYSCGGKTEKLFGDKKLMGVRFDNTTKGKTTTKKFQGTSKDSVSRTKERKSSNKQHTTKFVPKGNAVGGLSENGVKDTMAADDFDDYSGEENTGVQNRFVSMETDYSKGVKITAVTAAAAIVFGLAMVLAGLMSKPLKAKNDDHEKTEASNTIENND